MFRLPQTEPGCRCQRPRLPTKFPPQPLLRSSRSRRAPDRAWLGVSPDAVGHARHGHRCRNKSERKALAPCVGWVVQIRCHNMDYLNILRRPPVQLIVIYNKNSHRACNHRPRRFFQSSLSPRTLTYRAFVADHVAAATAVEIFSGLGRLSGLPEGRR
jgi:hypothetical protein